MKVVYVAGPFRSPTHWGIVQNVRHAEAWALKVWELGAVAICPHLNTANFQVALPDDAWLSGTLEMLRRCDAIFLVPGWETSTGTRAEREEAIRLGMEVLTDYAELEQWIMVAKPPLRAVGPAEGRSEVCAARERRDLGGAVTLHDAPGAAGAGIEIGLDERPPPPSGTRGRR